MAWGKEPRTQNWKHSIRLPTEARPSRGGAGGPHLPVAASLFLPGVRVSKVWLIEARVGNPNAASMNFSVELCSYTVGSRWPGRAKGEMTHVGTRGPSPYASSWDGATWSKKPPLSSYVSR